MFSLEVRVFSFQLRLSVYRIRHTSNTDRVQHSLFFAYLKYELGIVRVVGIVCRCNRLCSLGQDLFPTW